MKKLLTVLILAALALFVCTCSASAEAAEEAFRPEDFSDFENSILGQVIAIDGSTVSLQLGSMELPEAVEFPEGMTAPGDMEFPEGMTPPEDMEFPGGAVPPSDLEPDEQGHRPAGRDGQAPGAGQRPTPGFTAGKETETYVLDGLEISIHGDGSIREGSISDIAIGDILIIVEDENNAPELVIIWRSQPMEAPSAPSSENAD